MSCRLRFSVVQLVLYTFMAIFVEKIETATGPTGRLSAYEDRLVPSPLRGTFDDEYMTPLKSLNFADIVGTFQCLRCLVNSFMYRRIWRCLHVWYRINLRFSVVLFFIVVTLGEIGCFWWACLTWRVPTPSSNSLNLLLVSDSQIQGYRNEPSGILGCITRLDADWYLWKIFRLLMRAFSPDAVIHLGDVFDEGNIATDDEFLQYKARHNKIFSVPVGVSRIHVAGDNDIGGEWLDRITQKTVSRFSQHFGSINQVTNLKSFQIVKVNSLIFRRVKPLKDEWAIYNKTLAFIDELPSKLEEDKTTILIGHIVLNMFNDKIAANKLISAVQPRYAFSGDIHESATFQHQIGPVSFTEYVVPTCSYRMGTEKMGAAIAVIGVNGSIDYSVLPLPTRYTFFNIYLAVLVNCLLMLSTRIIVRICNKSKRKKPIFPINL